MPDGPRSLPRRPSLHYLKAAQFIQVAPSLREELVVLDQEPLGARVRVAGLEIVTAVGADPPYRGWIIRPGGDIALHAGSAAGSTALLVNRVRDSRAHVVLTTRLIAAMGSIDEELQQSWTNPAR
jgi:hypothetical protein